MHLKKNWAYKIIFCFVLLSLFYVLAYRENIYIHVHDNLDDIHARYKVLQDNALFWNINAKAPMLGGLDRNLLPSDLKVQSWIYMAFPAFYAYIILCFMKMLLSIAGGIFLGRTLLGEKYNEHSDTVVFCSFLYGILPNEPSFPLCFASLPLLIAIMINLYRNCRWYHYCAIFGTAFLSDLTYFGMFECGYILIFFFIDWCITGNPKLRIIGAFAALSLGLILIEWRLFYAFFFGDELIRSSMVIADISLGQAVKQSLRDFLMGHYHSADSHFFVVLPVCLIYFLCSCIRAIKEKGISQGIKELFAAPFVWLVIWILFNSVASGFDRWHPIMQLKSILPGLKSFQIARTLWFNGFLWYVSFCIVVIKIKSRKYKAVLCSLAFFAVCFIPQGYNHISMNINMMIANSLGESRLAKAKYITGSGKFAVNLERVFHEKTNVLSYNEFYSPELFKAIKTEISYHNEWSVAYGMHPAVLYCNGIATLDGYHPYYSQRYKNQFRKLIAHELETDETNRRYYDDWGGRAYIFSRECSYNPVKAMNVREADLLIDINVFRAMGGRYIFSRVAARNYAELGLKHAGTFSGYNSPYEIYVYKTY